MRTFKKNVRRVIAVIMVLFCLASYAFLLAGCSGGTEDLKIGVLWEDDTSGEAKAYANYLKDIAKEYNFKVDFTTTNSSSSEVAAINTYASKGYKAILLLSDDDIVASVNAASAKQMYVVCPTGHPTPAQYEQLKNMEFFLGSAAPDADTEFAAGYGMAKYFVEEMSQDKFTVFGGAAGYGVQMHVQRLAGMLNYLCEDDTTDYDGAVSREDLINKVSGMGVDPAKFHSNRYTITGYMDGFAFDDAFTTKLTNSLEQGGTCILSVGAGEAVSRVAYGIVSSNSKIPSFVSGGVDAIAENDAESFDWGYSYDCGKFSSAMAPGMIMILCAVNGNKILDDDGFAPQFAMNYWVATSKTDLTDMLASDNGKDGYCYNKPVLDYYIKKASYGELVELCGADYEKAVAIHKTHNPDR